MTYIFAWAVDNCVLICTQGKCQHNQDVTGTMVSVAIPIGVKVPICRCGATCLTIATSSHFSFKIWTDVWPPHITSCPSLLSSGLSYVLFPLLLTLKYKFACLNSNTHLLVAVLIAQTSHCSCNPHNKSTY